MSKRYTFTRPYEDAYEIVDRAVSKAMNPEDVVDRLNDLEAKLAESKFKESLLKADIVFRDNHIKSLKKDYKKLKQCFDKASKNCTFDELREIILTGEENSNERVIKMLNEQVESLEQQLAEKDEQLAEYRDINNAINSGLKDKCISCEEEHNQDKISFAVEQLKKVKEYWLKHEDVSYYIDNQIKLLQEKKDV